MKFCLCLFTYGVITSILINLCVYFVVDRSTQAISMFKPTDLGQMNAVAKDWETAPFIDLLEVEEDSCPDSHPELVYSRPFFGSDLGCDCR